MFRAATTANRPQFAARLASWRESAEHSDWFDGSVFSVDQRLAACEQLLTAARSALAERSLSESGPYLVAARELEADHAVLADLRDDLLNGAMNRHANPLEPPVTNVTSIPGQTRSVPGSMPPGGYGGAGAGIGQFSGQPGFKGGARRTAEPLTNQPTPAGPPASGSPAGGPGNSAPMTNVAPGTFGMPETATQGVPGHLGAKDQRWVALESARFAADNRDAGAEELAERAARHAATMTSTLTPARSRALTAAFVGAVLAVPRPRVRRQAARAALPADLPSELLFL